MFAGMTRFFAFLFLAWAAAGAAAQDRAAEAHARLNREAAEENYRIINGKLESIMETQDLLLRKQGAFEQRLNALASEIEELRRSHSQAGASAVTREQLKDVVEKIQEVDRKRVADNKQILEAFKDLQKIPVTPPVSTSRNTAELKDSKEKEPKDSPPPAAAENRPPSYKYVVKKGDLLEKIIAAYNEEFEKRGQPRVTRAQVLEANPGLRPDRIIAGRTIYIPIPQKKNGHE